jgi:hypothetical protein
VIVDRFELRPRYDVLASAREKARDKTKYNLTAFIVGDQIDDLLAFRLEAIFSFIEHLDVIVTKPVEIEAKNPFEAFPSTLPTHGRHDGGGATLMPDVYFDNSRAEFIRACLKHLEDEDRSSSTGFADLLFKKVETFRQRRPLLEVSYFLLYSGLEAHARSITKDPDNKNSSIPIANLLASYGFDVSVERPTDLKRAMSTYAHLRNALFHNAKIEKQVNINGQVTTLKLLDYYTELLLLVSLVVLKAAPFDDGHINWNSWIDRQPFK